MVYFDINIVETTLFVYYYIANVNITIEEKGDADRVRLHYARCSFCQYIFRFYCSV
jgi:hypothetical protein